MITQVGSQTVKDPRDLARIVAEIHSGIDRDVTERRDGQNKTISVKIAAMQDQAGAKSAMGDAGHGAKLGLALAPLDDQTRQEMNLPAGQNGVVIADVRPESPVDTAGLQSGDILEAVGDQTVNTPQQAVTALRNGTEKTGSAVALRVLRDGHQAFVALSATPASNG